MRQPRPEASCCLCSARAKPHKHMLESKKLACARSMSDTSTAMNPGSPLILCSSSRQGRPPGATPSPTSRRAVPARPAASVNLRAGGGGQGQGNAAYNLEAAVPPVPALPLSKGPPPNLCHCTAPACTAAVPPAHPPTHPPVLHLSHVHGLPLGPARHVQQLHDGAVAVWDVGSQHRFRRAHVNQLCSRGGRRGRG